MEWLIVGAVAGTLVGAVARRWRGWWLALAYGVGATGLVWVVGGIIESNRADEMAGIMPAVGAGLAFWIVVLPAATAAFALEQRRRTRRPLMPRSGDRRSGPSTER